jgi:hypothetical protein
MSATQQRPSGSRWTSSLTGWSVGMKQVASVRSMYGGATHGPPLYPDHEQLERRQTHCDVRPQCSRSRGEMSVRKRRTQYTTVSLLVPCENLWRTSSHVASSTSVRLCAILSIRQPNRAIHDERSQPRPRSSTYSTLTLTCPPRRVACCCRCPDHDSGDSERHVSTCATADRMDVRFLAAGADT